jgi:hypothetical protein
VGGEGNACTATGYPPDILRKNSKMKTKYIVLMIGNLFAFGWAFQYFDVKNMSTIGGILFVVGWLVVLGFVIKLSGADDEKLE